jgi:hypothetical protein
LDKEIDEFTRECLAIVVERQLNSEDVLATLYELFIELGVPDGILTRKLVICLVLAIHPLVGE